MAHKFESCANCGAPVETSADGRSTACSYCGARDVHAVDPTLLARSLETDSGSITERFERLAARLAAAFPDETVVTTAGGFLARKRVESFEIGLEGERFVMRREKKSVVAERVEIVRGIAIRTERLAVDSWIAELCRALSELAAARSGASAALARLFGR